MSAYTVDDLLQNPVEGQLWFNVSNNSLEGTWTSTCTTFDDGCSFDQGDISGQSCSPIGATTIRCRGNFNRENDVCS